MATKRETWIDAVNFGTGEFRQVETEIEKCERETRHARVPGTFFCRCTHVMDDGEEPPTTYESMEAAGQIGEFLPPTQEQMLGYLESEVIAVRQQRDELADALELAHALLQFKRGAEEKRITGVCEAALRKVGRFA